MNLRSSESSPQIAPLDETIKEMCQTEAQARGGGPSTPGATQAITSLDRGCQHGGRAHCPGARRHDQAGVSTVP